MLSPLVLEKKQNLVSEVTELLNRSSVIISFPTEGYTHKELSDLRRKLAEAKIKVVKNTLMKRAIEGTPFQALQSNLSGTNAWLFLSGDFKPFIEQFETANQENKKEVTFRYGVIDTYVFSGDELKRVLQLPSKKELIAQIAFAIQSVHTQLAASIHQVPTKLARAIHLAKGLDEKKEDESSE
ncbi:50S ribosomal protein L1 [Galdieria sulphuraria]|uniref:50S ribosomal protein L1 (Plastid) n=1 Tax=Galdieria sulphuraria TaxID=130081 RepID=M2VVN9_GALSU|nr:50S ribosomal protein L1 [Galdieria sulphuraria]EME27291.1 50S ribosomal protein L1 [Galdieria sulphuraria]|eukprot:XP_005703811.1 50S ribosomal protein L1 [Galdieria sulphuraria]